MPNKNKPKQEIIDCTDYEQHVNKCLDVVKTFKVLFISDLVSFLPFCRQTFYKYKLNENEEIKRAIDDNKVIMKQLLRSKWFESNNPTVQIALYKLICTPEERKILNNNNEFENPDNQLPKPFCINNVDKDKFC